ncbi:MAG: hypothetical protein IJY00_03820 [Bacteroidaceae bacterium]|nr:hypothetical protein [Bacteroidaceae bacterium]
MVKVFLLSLLIIAIGLLLISVKVLAGKRFVHTHIDGNKALNRKGIHCVQSMDAAERRENKYRINEKSKSKQ